MVQGPTGTGKSRWALESFPNSYWKQRSIWWDGYSNEETVVLDEYYGWLPFDTLLRLCDRYPLLVESKGGQLQFNSKKIVITTNSNPRNWYRKAYFPAFIRRVNLWIVMPTAGTKLEFTNFDEAEPHMIDNTPSACSEEFNMPPPVLRRC